VNLNIFLEALVSSYKLLLLDDLAPSPVLIMLVAENLRLEVEDEPIV
jgi:hypothetical protein